MKNRRSINLTIHYCAFTMALASAFAAPPETVRYERRSMFPWQSNVLTSHQGKDSEIEYGWQTFSPVTLARPEVLTGLRWTGGYEDDEIAENNPAPFNTVTWTVSIHADNEGKPGEALFSESKEAANVTMMEKGLVTVVRQKFRKEWHPYDELFFDFAFTFTEAFILEKDTLYWVSVVSSAQDFTPMFVWAAGSVDRNEARWPLDPQFISSEQSVQKAIEENSFEGETIILPRALALLGHPANDADTDGLDDAWELANGLDPAYDDHEGDPDDDGASNLKEFELGTDPRNPDTDGDGLLDGVESNGGIWRDTSDTGTSPLLPDTDQDGLIDSRERPGTNDASISSSDPNKSDTDLDAYGDGVEFANGFDPMSNTSFPAPIELETLIGNDLTESERLMNVTSGEEGFQKAFDNRLETSEDAWCCGNVNGSNNLYFTFDVPHVLESFTVTSSSSRPELDPLHFALRGSNDDGKTWDNIYTRLRYDERLWTERSQVLRFDAGLQFAKPRPYRMIRFFSRGSDQLTGDNFSLGELELFGKPFVPEIKSIERTKEGHVRLKAASIRDSIYTVDVSPDLKSWRPIHQAFTSEANETSYVLNSEAWEESLRAAYFRVHETGLLSADFETDADGWTVTTDSGETSWELGIPSTEPLSSLSNHTRIWGSNINGDYGPSTVTRLRSPLIDLSAIQRKVILAFQYYLDLPNDSEGGQLRFLDESGNVLLEHSVTFNKRVSDWTNYTLLLPDDIQDQKITIEFIFLSNDDQEVGAGWYIDNVVLR